MWKKGGNRRRGEIVTIAVLPAGGSTGWGPSRFCLVGEGVRGEGLVSGWTRDVYHES